MSLHSPSPHTSTKTTQNAIFLIKKKSYNQSYNWFRFPMEKGCPANYQSVTAAALTDSVPQGPFVPDNQTASDLLPYSRQLLPSTYSCCTDNQPGSCLIVHHSLFIHDRLSLAEWESVLIHGLHKR